MVGTVHCNLSTIGDLTRGDFLSVHRHPPELAIRSPGRAEILGNHTDYNGGRAISCGFPRALQCICARRDDSLVQLQSSQFPRQEVGFLLHEAGQPSNDWGNFARAVVMELLSIDSALRGLDILIHSDLPLSGGFSSSAAFEMSIACAFQELYQLPLSRLELAALCQRAENGPLLKTPSGLLDQATIALAEAGNLLLLDFSTSGSTPITSQIIPANLSARGYQLVVAVDFTVSRVLGRSAYALRRAQCQRGLEIINHLQPYPFQSLGNVSVAVVEALNNQLTEMGGAEVAARTRHVIYECERVTDAARHLLVGDYERFGELLSQSGESAIQNFGVDEEVPELRSLLAIQRQLPQLCGVRNMGGWIFSTYARAGKKRWTAIFQAAITKGVSFPLGT